MKKLLIGIVMMLMLVGCSSGEAEKVDKFDEFMSDLTEKHEGISSYSLREKGDEYILELVVEDTDANFYNVLDDLRDGPKELLKDKFGQEKKVIFQFNTPDSDFFIDIEEGTLTTEDGTEFELETSHE